MGVGGGVVRRHKVGARFKNSLRRGVILGVLSG